MSKLSGEHRQSEWFRGRLERAGQKEQEKQERAGQEKLNRGTIPRVLLT